MATADPKPASNVVTWPHTTYQPYVQPAATTYPTVWWNNTPTDEGRYKLALELIADAGLTKEAIERIAKVALRRPVPKAK